MICAVYKYIHSFIHSLLRVLEQQTNYYLEVKKYALKVTPGELKKLYIQEPLTCYSWLELIKQRDEGELR